jgi:hypothetical protein
MASKGLIVVPKPGQLIHELAAVAAPPDAARLHAIEAAAKVKDDAYARAKMAQSDAAFKQLSLGSWGSLPTVAAAKAAGEAQRMNAAIFEHLSQPSYNKAAVDAVNDFTRMKMKEDGYLHKLMPPLQISNDALDALIDTDKPVKVMGVDLGNGHQGGHAMVMATDGDKVMWQNSWGAPGEVGHITKEAFFDAIQIAKDLPPEPPLPALVNAETLAAIAKWGADESPDLVVPANLKDLLVEGVIKDILAEIDADTIKAADAFAFSDPTFIGKSYSLEDTTQYVKKESHLLEFFAYETQGAAIGNVSGLAGVALAGGDGDDEEYNDGEWDDDEIDEETSVDIVFWYYRDTFLVYSVRRVSDNFFYDFATKKFSMMPASPRAGMPRAEPAKPSGYVYWTKLSGKLDDGEYVVTIRDTKGDDAVVGITALFMKGGIQQGTPPQGLEDTPIEEGIPTPEGTFRRAARRVRPVDVEESK